MAKVPALTPEHLDDVMVGAGLPGGEQGFNLARIVTALLGWEVPGTTITRYCASSLQTTRMALHAIRAGEGHAFVSAGVEMVSRYGNGTSDAPETARNPRFADAAARTQAMIEAGADWTPAEGLPDVYVPMGITAENVARLRGVSREAMDDFAHASQVRYGRALASGFWAREIVPITLPDGRVLDADESPRPEADRARMAELAPVFRPDGVVTAGNACPLNDGAAAVIVTSDELAQRLGLTPLARIVSTGVSALDPEIMGLGPVEASRRALANAGMSMADIDVVEINEAFAAQVLPSAEDLGVDHERLNPHGGAIALGHPFGMTGARITGTLLNGLVERDGTFGLETMCVGGGQGMAMVVERLA
jgi:acetyl-CoA C-acetyltransferase